MLKEIFKCIENNRGEIIWAGSPYSNNRGENNA